MQVTEDSLIQAIFNDPLLFLSDNLSCISNLTELDDSQEVGPKQPNFMTIIKILP